MKGATKPSEKGGERASGELEFLTPFYQMPSGLMGICRVCVFFTTTPRGRYTYAHLIDKNIELQERSITSGVAELPIPRIRAMFSTPFWDGGECPGACLHFGVCTWHALKVHRCQLPSGLKPHTPRGHTCLPVTAAPVAGNVKRT